MDPPLEKITKKAWIFGNMTMAWLKWDPGEFQWKGSCTQQESGGVEFFKCSVKIGRAMLLADDD